jgi:hypothetical protein
MAEDVDEYSEYSEECCWDYPRDQCLGVARGCACRCHRVVADHPLRAFCAPATSCSMVHPCHEPGCTLRPEQHPGQSTRRRTGVRSR